MNKFDERYEFRFGKLNEVDAIMEWIGKNWRANHIMSIDKNLFEYEFKDGNQINIVLVIDKYKKTIEGLQGVLKFSYSDERAIDISGSFLKVLPTGNLPFLGVELMKRVIDISKCRYFCSIGSNPKTAMPLYKNVLKCYTVKLKHYYKLNRNYDSFSIGLIRNKIINTNIRNDRKVTYYFCNNIDEIKKNIDFSNKNIFPYKDYEYIEKRFINYPYYKYYLLMIASDNNEKCLVVFRKVSINNSSILRIVDFYGNQSVFGLTSSLFDNLLKEFEAEYVDFYNYGFSEEYIFDAGFVLKDENDKNILPNYLEPLVKENVDIYGVYNSPNVLFFKADGDQDRPNIVNK